MEWYAALIFFPTDANYFRSPKNKKETKVGCATKTKKKLGHYFGGVRV
jgi:hypothetical protein